MNPQSDIGLIGLGVMGSNLALNIADHGHQVAVFNRNPDHTDSFMASSDAKGKALVAHKELAAFVANIRKPAAVIIMVAAGDPVDQVIKQLAPLLAKGDIVIDAGNSFYQDTIRRTRDLEALGFEFVGMGVSGGEEGARRGPSLMPGGSDAAYRRLEPILNSIAAQVLGTPCCAHIGPDGAGHFVKMVHNGIEYADMQLIAEAYSLLRDLVGMDYPAMHGVFAEWNRGELESYLIEITADILGHKDPDSSQPICEVILDSAGQKGTGLWTSQEILSLGVAAPTLIEAVQARSLSAAKAERVAAARVITGPKARFAGAADGFAREIGEALYASKVCCYAQGFRLIAAAAEARGWNLDMGTLAKIWRGGCIIRARFLQRITDAYKKNPKLANLLLDDYFAGVMTRSQGAWRRVAAAAVGAGIPIPAFSSALAYYDGYRAERLPANLIQAQRDYFGAHTYQRVDKPGTFHTDWGWKG